jgi:hypothetical protein
MLILHFCRLITIYDCRVVLDWSATGADEISIRGTLVIPEVSHENTLDGVGDYTVSLIVLFSKYISLYSYYLLVRVECYDIFWRFKADRCPLGSSEDYIAISPGSKV